MHYHDIVTPPGDMDDWVEVIDKLVRHWVARDGLEEVRTWPFEVWNEPNLPAFWSGDQAAYFKLFEVTVRAIKAIDPLIPVDGPRCIDGVPDMARRSADPLRFSSRR